MMKRTTLAVLLVSVIALGTFTLCLGSGGEPGPPCEPDPLIQCMNIWDPVECVKPGDGWKIYSNACWADKDCANMKTCRRLADTHPIDPVP
jgi:hypothetical protein